VLLFFSIFLFTENDNGRSYARVYVCVYVWKTKRNNNNNNNNNRSSRYILYTRALSVEWFYFFSLCAFFTRLLLTRPSSVLYTYRRYISPKGGNGIYTRITVEIFRRVGFHRRCVYMYNIIIYRTIISATEQMYCIPTSAATAGSEGIFILFFRPGVKNILIIRNVSL